MKILEYQFLKDTVKAGEGFAVKIKVNNINDSLQIDNFFNFFIVDSSHYNQQDSTVTLFVHTYRVGNNSLDSVNVISNNDSLFLLRGEKVFVIPHDVDTTYKSSYYGIFSYPLPKGEVIGFLLGLVFFIVALIFIIKKILKQTKNKDKTEELWLDDTKTPLEKYEEILAMKLWEKGDIKTHYYLLTMVIKYYLTKTLNRRFLEFTTTELLQVIYSEYENYFDKEYLDKLRNFLKRIDLYKYTDMIPSVEEVVKDNDEVKNIITYQIETKQGSKNENT